MEIYISYGRNPGILCWAFDPHRILAIVELKGALRNLIDPLVQVIQPVFSLVNTIDNPIIYINETILRLLNRNKCPIQQLHLMHLVPTNVNLGLLDPTRLLSDLALDVLSRSVLVVVRCVESCLVHLLDLTKSLFFDY